MGVIGYGGERLASKVQVGVRGQGVVAGFASYGERGGWGTV